MYIVKNLSLKSKGKADPVMLRGTTRLNTSVFADRYDISKENYDSSLEFEPLKKEIIPEKSISNNDVDELLDRTNVPLDNTLENKHTEKPEIQLKICTQKNSPQFIKTIKNKPKNTKFKKPRKETKRSTAQLLNKPLNDSVNHDNFKESVEIIKNQKKRYRKSKGSIISVPSPSPKNEILQNFNVQDKMVTRSKAQSSKTLLKSQPNENSLQNSQTTENSPSISKKRKRQDITSNSIQTIECTAVEKNPYKSENSPPPKTKPRLVINKLAKKLPKSKFTKQSKLTKEQIKKVTTRKIPKNRLDDVLHMIDNDKHYIWEDRNTSCNPYIYRHWDLCSSVISNQNMKLKYARQFLLRRDWISLSKILRLSNLDTKAYYPLLSKYAALLLAHTDKEQFSKFIQFLTSATDSSVVMKKCTNISNEGEI